MAVCVIQPKTLSQKNRCLFDIGFLYIKSAPSQQGMSTKGMLFIFRSGGAEQITDGAEEIT